MSELRNTVLRLLTEAYPEAAICIFIHNPIEDLGDRVKFEHAIWLNAKNAELTFSMNEVSMAGYLEQGPDETFSTKREGMI